MAGLIPFNRKGRGNEPALPGFSGLDWMLDDFFKDSFFPRAFTKDTFKIDVEEKETGYVISAELPGISKDEVSLDLRDGRLTISVNKNETVEENNKNYIHRERRSASMSRSVYLADAKEEGAQAALTDGVLSVNIPRAEKKGGGRIEIK